MAKSIWSRLTASITGGAIIIALFSVLSKIAGLLRDRLLAANFGAGSTLDSYYAAFKIPDLIFNTLILGALASAFIPIFTKLYQNDAKAAWRLANSVLNILLIILLSLTIVALVIAPQLMGFIAPGFSGQQLIDTILLTRIMLLSIVFFAISNVVGGMLNSLRRFATFAAAPIIYNLGIILGIVLFYPWLGLTGLAWGVVLGAFGHLAIQFWEARKVGWQWEFSIKISQEVKRVFLLMGPRTVGLAGNQITEIIITMLATQMAAGSLAIYRLADNLQNVPIGLVGVSLAIAVFPVFAETLRDGNSDRFQDTFSLSVRRIIFFSVPITVFIILLRAQIVRVVLGAGQFDWQATYWTAQTLGWFAIGLFAQSLIPTLARVFYALEDTITPVLISLINVGLTIYLAWHLAPVYGVIGLAAAQTTGGITQLILLYIFLKFKLGRLDDRRIIWATIKITFNALLAGLGVYIVLRILANLVDMHTFWGIATQGLVAGLVGVLIYFASSLLTNCEEIALIKNWLGKYWRFLAKRP
ncbi:MAG: murein biosynthesis integral membrane protein MurJ [Candidatus Komeilibacteria bacterium]|nr:murein biosynthesis integral membrane protein MurJ [Candidatus Komeilibacteria bacterium]